MCFTTKKITTILYILSSTILLACGASKKIKKNTEEETIVKKETIVTPKVIEPKKLEPIAPLEIDYRGKLDSLGNLKNGTPNFSLRKPNYVVIHHTAQNSCDQTLYTFAVKHSEVSSHYVICRNGVVHQLLSDYLRSYHAGKGKWGSITDMNSISIGIEIDNNGTEPFSNDQMNSLLTVLDSLKFRYNIPAMNIIGHSDWAPGRKSDPSVKFSWEKLAERGFGIWYSKTEVEQLVLPPNFEVKIALRIIGYDVTNLEFATKSFKRKYLLQNNSGSFNTDFEKKVLYYMMQKSM